MTKEKENQIINPPQVKLRYGTEKGREKLINYGPISPLMMFEQDLQINYELSNNKQTIGPYKQLRVGIKENSRVLIVMLVIAFLKPWVMKGKLITNS